MFRTARAYVTSSLVLLTGAPLRGQPAGAPVAEQANDVEQRKEAAAGHFVRGVELGRSGDWEGALREFRSSRSLHVTRASLLNIAVSLYNLKRYVQALESYEQLERQLDDGDKQEKAKAAAAIAKLKTLVAEVVVSSNVEKPYIVLDGDDRGRLLSKVPLRVDPGTHRLRLSLPGYLPLEREFTVVSGQTKELDVTLLPLSQVSRIDVREASGKRVEVLIDGHPLGTTPIVAVVSRGYHTIALRGPDRLGTVPVQTHVAQGQAVALSLRAVPLDADVRIEPTPVSARVDFDGIPLGVGLWQGRLPSGRHHLEVYAEGHLPWRQLVTLRRGSQTIAATLERDARSPLWRTDFLRSLYLELAGGFALSPSLGGGADAACDRGECSDRSWPLGGLATFRAGYLLTPRLGLEVVTGYMYASSSSERSLELSNNDPTPVRFDARLSDQTRLAAVLAGLGFGYQLLDRWPVIVRMSAGVARARVQTAVSGRFRATIQHPEHADVVHPYDQSASLVEEPQNLWIPWITPEARLGYPVTSRFTIDAGIAAWLLFAPSYPRTGGVYGEEEPEARSVGLREVANGYDLGTLEGTRTVKPGVVTLPREVALGTTVMIVPSLAARLKF